MKPTTLLFLLGLTAASAAGFKYPVTPVRDVAETIHGVTVHDPYRWLEDATNPEVQTWISQQDSLARQYLRALPGRDELLARLRLFLDVEARGVPTHEGNRYFFTRRKADEQQAVLYWTEGPKGQPHTLLDPDTWSNRAALKGWYPNHQGTRIAYTVTENFSDEATMYVMDVASGQKSSVDVLPGAKYAVAAWTPDGDGFYYTWIPPVSASLPIADRPGLQEVRFHPLGHDPTGDPIIVPPTGNPTLFLSVRETRDGHWLLLRQHSTSSSQLFCRDLRGTETSFTSIPAQPDCSYSMAEWRDQFYVQTNEGASHGRLFRVDPKHLERDHWQAIVPEHLDELREFGLVGGCLALNYLDDATSRIEICDLDGHRQRIVTSPEPGTWNGPYGRPDTDEAFFSYSSFTRPPALYSLSMASGKLKLSYQVRVPFDASRYTTDQVFFPSQDGTRLTMFIVHRKGLKLDGHAATLLTGYGGFSACQTPQFSGPAAAWIERGGVWAEAVLRGGGEYGESWHRDGMLLKKQNSFDDLTAAARYLIRYRYTTPQRLCLSGTSNGGLLVVAAMTQHPELYRAVVCSVPLLDMVRYELFESGKTWISEYGSVSDEAQFKALLAYSPYHHVQAGVRYPSVLMLSADSDDRVDPMHARKFTAALQADSIGGPVLLRVAHQTGHGGPRSMRDAAEPHADQFAFLLHQLHVSGFRGSLLSGGDPSGY